MSSHQERSDKSPTSDTKRPSDSRATEEVAEAPKVSPLRQKLTLAGHYAMLGLAPFIAVCALIVAVFAVTGNQSGEEQLGKSKAKIENLNTALLATKSDLDKLKASIALDKAMQDDERKKQEERIGKIIQNITPLQMKLKISSLKFLAHSRRKRKKRFIAVLLSGFWTRRTNRTRTPA